MPATGSAVAARLKAPLAGARGRLALRAVHATRLVAGDQVRLAKLVQGLASEVGMEPPELWTIPNMGPNALVVRRPRPAIAVSAGLLETYTRTELEAVVAFCLVRLRRRPRPWSPPASASDEDRHAVSLTRYPPALARAIDKAEPAKGPFASLWFVAEQDGGTRPSARIAELLEL